MTKRFMILALLGFVNLPQLSHGFTFLSGKSYYQKVDVFDTGPPTWDSLYGLDYSRTAIKPFTTSAQAMGHWSGMSLPAPYSPRLSGLTLDLSSGDDQYASEPVPEPATLFLVGLGLLGAGVYKRYFRRS